MRLFIFIDLAAKALIVSTTILSLSNCAVAEEILTDIDMTDVRRIADNFMPGDILLVTHQQGAYAYSDGPPQPANISANVSLWIDTDSGGKSLIVSKIDDKWLITDTEKARQTRRRRFVQRLAEMKERAEQRRQDLVATMVE